MGALRIGTAGWSISSRYRGDFPGGGSQLERYAARFSCVEINTSFYRPHRPDTYRRWADGVPADFRFSVKLPKALTHERRLAGCEAALDGFLCEVAGLREKLAVLLVQTPPNLAFDADVAGRFLDVLRQRTPLPVAWEARHLSWFAPAADAALAAAGIVRVLADPWRPGQAAMPVPGGGLAYFRWHGAPRVYYSDYDDAALAGIAARVAQAAAPDRDVWCIMDNTAHGHALANALDLTRRLAPAGS